MAGSDPLMMGGACERAREWASLRLDDELSVLEEEIDMILDMGVEIHYSRPVESMKALLDEGGFDAVFVGTGAEGEGGDEPPRRGCAQSLAHVARPAAARPPRFALLRRIGECAVDEHGGWTHAAPAEHIERALAAGIAPAAGV